ncbi:MAG TPA: AMP-binding protein [Jatrophihabitans sp.]|nr:AMP-binding protein [Jatrophihabitans sp.]
MTPSPHGRSAAYPTNRLIHQMIAAQAAARPEQPAVVTDGDPLSYRDLDRWATAIAAGLRSTAGARPGVRIGVCLPRGPEAAIALLGVVRSGAAPVLIDPGAPPARTGTNLRDAHVRTVLVADGEGTPAAVRKLMAATGLAAVPVVRGSDPPPAEFLADPPLSPHSAAHISYTSGSTGTAKGVLARHAAVLQCVHWAREALALTAEDRLSWLSPPGFGISLMNELWPALATGCTVYVPDTQTMLFAERMQHWLLANRVTVVQLTRTLAEPLFRLPWPTDGGPRLLILTGEAIKHWPPADLPFEVAVTYGSTETTHVTSWLDRAAGIAMGAGRVEPPPVGWPVANMSAYVLDPVGMPVDTGTIGEVHVAGPGLAGGYLGDPAQTAARWLPDPFGVPGGRRFATGDLGRRLPDGSLQIVGRVDRQVKVRGQRTNLDEIEAVLCSQPGVADAAVVAHGDGDALRLVAYLAGVDRGAVAAIHGGLAATLPSYALPSDFVLLDRLPRTVNGKLDRQALPEPAGRRDASPAPLHLATDGVEQDLVELWRRLLGRNEVGIADSFFDLGGHSMIAVQMVSAIEDRWGVQVDLAAFYSHPTIAEMAATLRPSEVPWLVRPQPAAEAQVRLVCFPYAGGGPATYGDWPRLLPADVEVICVQPPARGQRLNEPPVHRLDDLVDAVGEALLADHPDDLPLVFFGHSVGAIAAFEVARWLRRRGLAVPAALLVSGSAAPQLPIITRTYLLPDEELWVELHKLGGTPDELLHDAALRDVLLPALRADFEMHETYRYLAEAPLDCPVTAIGGRNDEISTDSLDQWQAHTTAAFRRQLLPGGHFYLDTDRDAVLDLVRAAVLPLLTRVRG